MSDTVTALEEQCTEPSYLALGASGSLGADVLPSGQQEKCGYMGRQLLLAMNGCKHIPSTVFLLITINVRRTAAIITAIRISTNADRPPATPPTMAATSGVAKKDNMSDNEVSPQTSRIALFSNQTRIKCI